MEENIFLLIPAYNPKETFVDLYNELKRNIPNLNFLIVNDGSYSFDIFDKISQISSDRTFIISHSKNMGKGSALKTGFKYIIENYKNIKGIITCDCDYQHLPSDVNQIICEFKKNNEILLLGSRFCDKKKVPFHRLLGNRISSFLFYKKTKVFINDTQTGLRAIPIKLANNILSVTNSDFTFELIMLLSAIKENIQIKEFPISTIYLTEKKSSHFNPIFDSLKILHTIIKYKI